MSKIPCALALMMLLTIMSPGLRAQEEIPDKAHCYIRAYPGFFKTYKDGYLIAVDGRRIRFDDGVSSKDYERMVRDRHVGDKAFDPEDALYWDYAAGEELPTAGNPPEGDPGRIRPAELFGYMYGQTKSERRKKMRPVRWIGSVSGRNGTMLVTTVNGVDKAVEKIAFEIGSLPEEKKRILQGIVLDVDAFSGYYDRAVRDYPRRTSAHAYGIAVDVNHDDSYFIGRHKGEPYLYRNNMPLFLIEIFERHGFIWGGRWRSYDIMHFEYRPELLLKGDEASQTVVQNH